MADDLDSFFKKKANKKKKTAKVQNIEKLGKKLEKSAKLQEEIDRENDERQQREKDQEEFIQSRLQEDTEWIDFSEKEVNIQDLNIKDMDIGEVEEQEQNEDGVVEESKEQVRTWNVPNENDKPVENGADDTPVAPAAPAGPKMYRAPGSRMHIKKDEKPDINSEDLFPSLSAADELESKQKEKEKREEAARILLDSERRAANARHNEPAVRRPVQINQMPAAAPADPNKSSYVPPALRQAGGGAAPPSRSGMGSAQTDAQGYQTQNQRRMGGSTGNAWGAPRQAVAPTNNRFDGLMKE